MKDYFAAEMRYPKSNTNLYRIAQIAFVLLCAAALKWHYSTASVNELRWILAPTALFADLITGARFEFESNAGYINKDRDFLIAAPCSGVNFLITAFLMLSLARLLRDRSRRVSWRFIPAAAAASYLTTIAANTVRVSAAMRSSRTFSEESWLNPQQVHRLEGIFIYFGFLLLLFFVSEKLGKDKLSRPRQASNPFRRSFIPLAIYYATTLGIPLANGAYRQGSEFWEHALFVLLTPALLILLFAAFPCFRVRNRLS